MEPNNETELINVMRNIALKNCAVFVEREYTDKARSLEHEVAHALYDIVCKSYSEGMTIEAICYIVHKITNELLIEKSTTAFNKPLHFE